MNSVEKEIQTILKSFYMHMNGVDDYGCKLCIEFEKKLITLVEDKLKEQEKSLKFDEETLLMMASTMEKDEFIRAILLKQEN